MFKNLQEVCQYKRSYVINSQPSPKYECTYGDDVATHTCSEAKCPFMKAINQPHIVENFVVDKEKVIEAFSKYQKKKVTKVYYKTANGNMSSRCCPTCNKTLLGAVEENYCLHCGQHLDWEVK